MTQDVRHVVLATSERRFLTCRPCLADDAPVSGALGSFGTLPNVRARSWEGICLWRVLGYQILTPTHWEA